MATNNFLYRVAVKGSYLSRPWSNVFDYRQIGPEGEFAGVGVEDPLLEAIKDLYVANFPPLQNVNVKYEQYTMQVSQGYRATVIPDTDPPKKLVNYQWIREYVRDFDTVAGLLEGQSLNSFAAAKGGKYTSRPGRAFKGSVHFPGLNEDKTEEQIIQTTPYTDWFNAWALFALNIYTVTVGGIAYTFKMCVLGASTCIATNDNYPWTDELQQLTRTTFNKGIGSMTRRKARHLINPANVGP